MEDPIAKWLPIVVGLSIGWMLFHPPAFLAPLGGFRYLVMVLAGAVALLASVVAMVLAAMPRELKLTPSMAPIDPVVQNLVQRYQALGFRTAGPPYTVGMTPAATMVGLVHGTEPVYGSVFRTGTVPAVVGFDFFSYLEGDRGGLTTSGNPRGGTLTADPGSFRQVLAGANPEQLFAAHCEAARWLATRGLRCKGVSPTAFADDFTHAVGRLRRHFLKNPIGNALTAIGRTASARYPCQGPLSAQPAIDAQIQALVTGNRG